MMLNPVLETVTERIKERSLDTRRQYLARMANAAQAGPARGHLSCSNLAHGMAACASQDKNRLTDELVPNIAIVTAYNDMLSAHAPYERYPALIKETAEGWVRWLKSQAEFPRCVMGSLRDNPAWICRCFRET